MLRYLETMASSTAASILHERRQLETELLQADAGPTVEDLADLGRAGEADKAHGRVLAQKLADPPESPAMTLKTPLGTPAFSARAASATAESGRLTDWLQHHGAPAASAGPTSRVISSWGSTTACGAAGANRWPDASSSIRARRENRFAIVAARLVGVQLDIGATDIEFA